MDRYWNMIFFFGGNDFLYIKSKSKNNPERIDFIMKDDQMMDGYGQNDDFKRRGILLGLVRHIATQHDSEISLKILESGKITIRIAERIK